MYDLSVRLNLVVFVAFIAVCVIWLFLAIDVIAAKQPKGGLKAACLTLGIIGLIASLALAAASVGLALGFVTLEGNAAVIASSLKMNGLAEFFALLTYYVSYGFTAALFVLSLLLIVSAAVKRSAAKEDTVAPAAEEPLERETAAASDSKKADETPQLSDDMPIAEVRSLMDEISGLVDSLDLSLDENSFPAPDASDFEDEEYDAEDEPAEDGEPDDVFKEEETAEARESENMSENETEDEPAVEDEPAAEEDNTVTQEEIAAAETVATGLTRGAVEREIDDFKEVEQERARTRTIVRGRIDDTAKEARPLESGLPMKKRHVLLNRRNVVNMFSDYLKSKSADEKARIESSINTIIIK